MWKEYYDREEASSTRLGVKQRVPLPVQDRIRCKQVSEAVACQVLEKVLEGEMDAHWGYEKNSVAGNHIVSTSGIAVTRRKSRPNMESLSFTSYVTVPASLS